MALLANVEERTTTFFVVKAAVQNDLVQVLFDISAKFVVD
jgi:hypothetical protein